MVVKLFGFMDFLASIAFILINFGLFKGFAIFMGIYLLLKGIIFFTDIISWIDLICGIYLLLIVWGVGSGLSILCIIWLLQKAAISFFS